MRDGLFIENLPFLGRRLAFLIWDSLIPLVLLLLDDILFLDSCGGIEVVEYLRWTVQTGYWPDYWHLIHVSSLSIPIHAFVLVLNVCGFWVNIALRGSGMLL